MNLNNSLSQKPKTIKDSNKYNQKIKKQEISLKLYILSKKKEKEFSAKIWEPGKEICSSSKSKKISSKESSKMQWTIESKIYSMLGNYKPKQEIW